MDQDRQRDQLGATGPSRRKVLAATAGAAAGAGIGAIMATPAAAASVAQPMANTLVGTRFLAGWGGAACVEFNINDMLAQNGKVCDIFVATGSASPIILATGGAIGTSAISPYHNTHHVGTINCHPYQQGGRSGVRLRINFVDDSPQRNMVQKISIFQVDAQYFSPPEPTVGAP